MGAEAALAGLAPDLAAAFLTWNSWSVFQAPQCGH
jgi:hypothetical protein